MLKYEKEDLENQIKELTNNSMQKSNLSMSNRLNDSVKKSQEMSRLKSRIDSLEHDNLELKEKIKSTSETLRHKRNKDNLEINKGSLFKLPPEDIDATPQTHYQSFVNQFGLKIDSATENTNLMGNQSISNIPFDQFRSFTTPTVKPKRLNSDVKQKLMKLKASVNSNFALN